MGQTNILLLIMFRIEVKTSYQLDIVDEGNEFSKPHPLNSYGI